MLKLMVVLVMLVLVVGVHGASAQGPVSPEFYAGLQDRLDMLWKTYDTKQSAAWNEYDAKSNKLWQAYSEFEHTELMKLRSADYPHYLEWLDAEKVGNFKKRVEMERTVPALLQYRRAVSERYRAYSEEKRKLYAQYEATKKAAYDQYIRDKTATLEARPAKK